MSEHQSQPQENKQAPNQPQVALGGVRPAGLPVYGQPLSYLPGNAVRVSSVPAWGQQVQYVSQAPVVSQVQAPVQLVSQPVVQQSVVQQAPQSTSTFEYIPYQREYVDYEQVTKTEYVPVQRQYTDYEAVQRVEQVPVTRTYTDYYTVEHQVEYVPQVSYTTVTDQVPVQRSYVEQVPVQRVVTEYVAETRNVTEYVAQQRQVENVEYVPVTKQVVHNQPQVQAPVVQAPLVSQPVVVQQAPVLAQSYVQQAPVQYVQQAPVQYVQQAPVQYVSSYLPQQLAPVNALRVSGVPVVQNQVL